MLPFDAITAATCYHACNSGYSSDDFIVGLTNDFDADDTNSTTVITLWSYTLCGQYPDTVPGDAY